MTAIDTSTPSRLTSCARCRAIVAACIGNFLEWYEFVLYGYFAAVFATLFFPQEDPAVAMLTTFLVFGISFIIRPLGGLLFGVVGDKLGRKTALSAIIIMISVAYRANGPRAALREYWSSRTDPDFPPATRARHFRRRGWMGAVTYIIETAPAGKRAWYGSFQTITIVLGDVLSRP